MRIVLLALVACWGWGGSDAARILAVMPIPARSHLNIITTITKGLAHRGHDVTFIGADPIKDAPPNHRVIAIGNPFEDTINETLAIFFKDKMNPVAGQFFLWTWGETMVNGTLSHPAFQAEINKPGVKYDLVVVEAFFFQEALVAIGHKLNVPVISINPFGTYFLLNEIVGNPVNPSWVPSPFLGYTDHMTLLERTFNTLFITYQYIGFYLFHIPKQQALVSKYFPDSPPLTELLSTQLALTLINNHFTLFYPAPMSPNVVEIGGVHIKDKPQPLPKDLQDYMDSAKDGVVFFSMGSNLKLEFLPKHKADAILAALGSVKQKVLLKWDGPTPKVASNIRIVDWVPQADLLAHPNLRAFVSHGGLLSTQEAVYHGVPMVGIPVFGDQHFNMKLAVNKGFCTQVDLRTITKEALVAAVKEVTENPKYAKAAKHLSVRFRSKPQRPLDTAMFWIEHVLQHGGEHLRPSSLDLAVPQLLLLDVLLVLLAPVLLLALCCRALCCRRRKASPSVPAPSKSKKRN